MNQHNLIVKKRQSYGRELIYPVCEHAQLFCRLLNCKTFSRDQIEQIKRLGFVFEIDPNEMTL